MSIQYELSLNKLTTPASYAPRVRPRDTLDLATLGAQIAGSSTLALADVQAVLTSLTEQIQAGLLAGNWVALDGIGIITSSLTGRLPTPTSPLPSESQVDIGFRADTRLRKNLRANAHFERLEPTPQAPLLLTLVAESGGGLGSIAAGDVLRLSGDRLRVHPAVASEGVFLVGTTGSPIKVENYLENGDKQLLFVLPSLAGGSSSFTLEVRARRENSTTLRTTAWPAPLELAP
jgi:hypothetical protein